MIECEAYMHVNDKVNINEELRVSDFVSIAITDSSNNILSVYSSILPEIEIKAQGYKRNIKVTISAVAKEEDVVFHKILRAARRVVTT